MLAKLHSVIRFASLAEWINGENPTIGQVSRYSHKPYSTVKRYLEKAEKLGLVESGKVEYKTTGKTVYALTEKGIEFLKSYRELPL